MPHYCTSHETDTGTGYNFAMDLTPLVSNPALDTAEYVHGYMDRLANIKSGTSNAKMGRTDTAFIINHTTRGK